MKIADLSVDEYNAYYKSYIEACGSDNLMQLLENGLESFSEFIKAIPQEKLNYNYAEGKWTVAEVLVHLLDTERVFQYRALRFARNDKTPLPGFDQDVYVPESNSDQRDLTGLIEEYKAVRLATIALFKTFNVETLMRKGVASDSDMSVRALGFIINGHQKHHAKILKERYGL